jgi:uncharacterized membrane protein
MLLNGIEKLELKVIFTVEQNLPSKITSLSYAVIQQSGSTVVFLELVRPIQKTLKNFANKYDIWFQKDSQFIIIHSFILLAVMQQVHSRFQSEFTRESDLMLPVSVYNTLSFP